eukprot:586640-Rhodomonas_salina.8
MSSVSSKRQLSLGQVPRVLGPHTLGFKTWDFSTATACICSTRLTPISLPHFPQSRVLLAAASSGRISFAITAAPARGDSRLCHAC